MAPPAKEMSVNRWHAVRYQLTALQRQRLEETHSMLMEDVQWEEGQGGRRAERIQTELVRAVGSATHAKHSRAIQNEGR